MFTRSWRKTISRQNIIKPYIQTTISHDFSDKLKNLLNRHYNPTKPNVTWWKISKNKQAMIQDIHAELRCNNQSKIINLFSHVTKLLGNINIFWFHHYSLRVSFSYSFIITHHFYPSFEWATINMHCKIIKNYPVFLFDIFSLISTKCQYFLFMLSNK